MGHVRSGHPLTEPILLKIIALQTEIAKYGVDLAGVTTTVVERLPSLTNAEGAILEYAEGREMVYRGVSGIAQPLLGLRVRRAGSLSGSCVREGRVLYAEDTEMDPRVDRLPCRRVGIRSLLTAPLNHNGTTVGVLKLVSTRIKAFEERDVRVLEIMSELIASSMYNAARSRASSIFKQRVTRSRGSPTARCSMTAFANEPRMADAVECPLGFCRSTWTVSKPSTTVSDIAQGTRPFAKQPSGSGGFPARTILWGGWVETSLVSFSRTRVNGAMFLRLPSALSQKSGCHFGSRRSRFRSVPASAWPIIRTMVSVRIH